MKILYRIFLYLVAINIFISFCWLSLIDKYLGKMYLDHEKEFMEKLSNDFDNLKTQ